MDLIRQLPEPVRLRAEACGDTGRHWLNELPGLLSHLREKWSFRTGQVLAGGSEALVMTATLASGVDAILKIALPEADGVTQEAAVMILADGRGYAKVLQHDSVNTAMLLERLGSKLADVVPEPEEQHRIICETLDQAWMKAPDNPGLMTGAEKAMWLHTFISDTWEALGRPLQESTIRRALDYCDLRASAFSPNNCVVVHGDAHSANTLLIDDQNPGQGCKFIDPDGLFAERAADLAAIMRDNNEVLLQGNTVKLARQRAERLAELTDGDVEAIWQWGHMERVSTGLMLQQIGLAGQAAAFYQVASKVAA